VVTTDKHIEVRAMSDAEHHDITDDEPVDAESRPDLDDSAMSTGEHKSEAGDNVDPEPTGAKRPTIGHGRRRWRNYLRRSVIPLVVAVALGTSCFLGWIQWQQHRQAVAGQQAQQAALAYAQALTSIDSNNVDQNFRQVLDGATGEFKDMYTQSSVQLRQLLIENKATAHGIVVESAIQSTSPNKVVVLLFIDQSVTNSQLPDPRMDRSRIKMTMEKVDGRWLASKVQLL
jgi:Mce-associated membrane protein